MTNSLFGTILYGASYYHEYMPDERLATDIDLMVKAGLTAVRMGDSIWPLVEPKDGTFDFSEIARVVDAMHAAGIKVILTTPTYTLPAWMVRKYPEVLADTRNGRAPSYGMRQNMNTCHPAYRFYCQRIIRALVSHFHDHPGVIGWQIDNETASYDAANRDVFLGFVDWLKVRYGTIEHLNKVWLNAYWGQTLGSWEEFQQQDRAQSTGYRLDWTRYQKHRVTDFMAFQAKIVREYRRPDQFVMQDFAAGFHTDVDEGAVAAHLDVVGGNPYHPTQDLYDGHVEVLNADYYRMLKGGRYIVTETNGQSLGWASTLQYPPYDGQTRLSVFTNVACGAELISYWHWHSLHSGQETFWKGILSHDLEPNRVYAEFQRTAQELKRVGPVLAGAKRQAEVAIIYSGDSMNALGIMPITAEGHSSDVSVFIPKVPDYPALIMQLHKQFYDLNVATDIVSLDAIQLEDYKLVVLPALYIATEAQLKRIADYVLGGGHVLATFKTGFCDENSFVRPVRAPGPLRAVAGFSYQEFSNLAVAVPVSGSIAGSATHWAEFLLLEGASALAHYDHPFFGRWPAVTTHQTGAGRFTYMGGWLNDVGQAALVRYALDTASVAIPELSPTLRCHNAVANDGRRLHFLLNYGSDPVRYTNTQRAVDLLSGADAAAGSTITIEAWGVCILCDAL